MTSSRKKILTTICAFVLVVAIAGGAIWFAFAAINASVNSGFNITYVARNVSCIVSGEYLSKDGTQKGTLGEDLVFSPEDPDKISKSFSKTPTLTLDGPEDWVEFRYTIENTGTNGINLTLATTGLEDANFKVQYTKCFRNSADQPKTYDFGSSNTHLTQSYIAKAGLRKSFIDVGIRVSVPGRLTSNLSAVGNFTFTLDGFEDEKIVDIWNEETQTFNLAPVTTLLKQISGDSSVDVQHMDKINTLAEKKLNAADIRKFEVEKNSGSNVTVTFGNMQWYATYLSKDNAGNAILTLWLTGSRQETFDGLSRTAGEYFGYLNSNLYSDFSANWTVRVGTQNKSSCVYGTSYIRCVTLNNGGKYTEVDGDITATQDENSPFALFTMQQSRLLKYLVQPKDVAWQQTGEVQNQKYANDYWDESTSEYGSEEGYSAWKEDYLWLPSSQEVYPYKGFDSALWQLERKQLQNPPTSSSNGTIVGRVGTANGVAYQRYWLRSNTNEYYNRNAQYVYSDGSDVLSSGVNESCAVRPALHLNLTALAEALNA